MKKAFYGIIILLIISNTAVWHALYIESRPGELTVAFLDIGQGDSIFIEAPNGNQILVDGGPNAKVLHEIGSLMPWYDKSLDAIVVTNPDKDHIAGFVDVLKRYKVSYAFESGTENASLVNRELHDLIQENKLESVVVRRGMKIFLDEKAGVVLTILFPDKDVSKEKTNDGSIVARLTYGETEVMLTGDAPSTVESHLLSLKTEGDGETGKERNDLKLESDILKVGHHGSKTSTSESFVKTIAPQYAVISSGKGNKYGHPNEETLATLAKFPVKVFRTDHMGTIVMKSDGKSFRLVN